MQKKILWFAIIIILVFTSSLHVKSQDVKQDSTFKRWFIGSTLMMAGNFIPDDPNPPEYIQLNAGYRVTPKDVVSFRFKRSIYAWPIGIPFGPSVDAPGLNYPGHARILAPALGYQRFWWKGAYTAVYAMNAFEKYMDKDNKKIGNGFTLYIDSYVGYHFKFFKNRFFIEPAIGVSFWPIRKNVPESFKQLEKKWNNYIFQPRLDFGFKF